MPPDPPRIRPRNRPPRGYSLLELIVALSLLGTATATIVPVLGWAHAQRRAAAARRFAVCEAENLLERITSADWDDVTQEKADVLRLPEAADDWLRAPRLTVAVVPEPQPPVGRRVTVEIRWKNREGDDASPVRLTGFVFRRGDPP